MAMRGLAVALLLPALAAGYAIRPATNAHAPRPLANARAAPRMTAASEKKGSNWWNRLTVGDNSKASRAKVAEHMSRKVTTLEAEMPLQEAACVLADRAITGAPVVDDGKLVGVLSQSDLLFKAAGADRVPLAELGKPQSERYADNTQRLRKVLAGDVRSAMVRRANLPTSQRSLLLLHATNTFARLTPRPPSRRPSGQ